MFEKLFDKFLSLIALLGFAYGSTNIINDFFVLGNEINMQDSIIVAVSLFKFIYFKLRV